MRDLIDDVFVGGLGGSALDASEDQARVPLAALTRVGDRLAFTTDSYVVEPLFFPGADIGMLAVNGTVNDLAVGGAVPLFLSVGVILEEGFDVALLRRVVASMRRAADAAGVDIVTGDTKVVHRGAADGLFINTAGIGVIRSGVHLHAGAARPGDVVLVNGALGEHGAAVLNARGELGLEADLASDCAPLGGLVDALLAACPDVRALRDATRGGVATVLNEFARASDVGIRIDEHAVVPGGSAERALETMREHPAGTDAAVIGEVCAARRGTVVLASRLGGERIVDMLVGEQLPRIC
jgi:hydrogenase expression/formation protein HypE